MINKRYKERLVHLGLTEKEAIVYLALLKLGPTTASEASEQAGLNRSTTYVQIKQLMSSGLASSIKNGKKTLFAAESPNNLEQVFEMRVRELESKRASLDLLVPDLTDLFVSTASRPTISIFEGKEGLLSMRNAILDAKPKNLYIATSFDEFRKIFTKKERDDFRDKSKQRGIATHVLFTSDTVEAINVPEPGQSKKIKRHDFVFSSDVYVYNDTVAFASLGHEVTGIMVSSSNIAQAIKNFFELTFDNK